MMTKSFGRWLEKGRQRRRLMALDDRLLRDIGIQREEIDRIAHKRSLGW